MTGKLGCWSVAVLVFALAAAAGCDKKEESASAATTAASSVAPSTPPPTAKVVKYSIATAGKTAI